MADREKVIKGLEQIVNDPFMKARADYWVIVCSEAIVLLKENEAVVKCKDCKKHDTYDCSITYLTTQKTPNDWFCADGERRVR